MSDKECRLCGGVIREGDDTAIDHEDVHAGCADPNSLPATSGLKRATRALVCISRLRRATRAVDSAPGAKRQLAGRSELRAFATPFR